MVSLRLLIELLVMLAVLMELRKCTNSTLRDSVIPLERGGDLDFL